MLPIGKVSTQAYADNSCNNTPRLFHKAAYSLTRAINLCVLFYNYTHYLLLGTSALSSSSGTRWANDRSARPEWGARCIAQDRWLANPRTHEPLVYLYTQYKELRKLVCNNVSKTNNQYIRTQHITLNPPSCTTSYDIFDNILLLCAYM